MEVDLVICATTTPDMLFPATANIICNAVGIKNAFSYDIQAACSGFLFALTTGSQFIETGKYKKAGITVTPTPHICIFHRNRLKRD